MRGAGTDREGIIAAIRRAAEELGGLEALSQSQFRARTGITTHQVLAHFDGWSAAVTAAGLRHAGWPCPTDEELFRAMRTALEETEGNLTIHAFDRRCRYSRGAYRRRFGSWRQVLAAFRRWLEETGESFRYLDRLPVGEDAVVERRRGGDAGARARGEARSGGASGTPRAARLGAILNYREMMHAPVNEQGVVLMFGMLCGELGFVVESVQVGYPDCEAKRQAGKRREGWERVRIEFEYRSSSFRDAGHDPAGCDLVVCWAHDWGECPVEVLELRRVVGPDEDRGVSGVRN